MYKSWSMHDAFYKGLAPSDNMLICLDKRSFGYSDAGCVRNKRKYIYIYQDVWWEQRTMLSRCYLSHQSFSFNRIGHVGTSWNCLHYIFHFCNRPNSHLACEKFSVSGKRSQSWKTVTGELHTTRNRKRHLYHWGWHLGLFTWKGPEEVLMEEILRHRELQFGDQFHAANLCIASMWLQAYETQSLFPSSWLLHLGTLDIHKKNVEILSAASNTVGRRLKA